MFYLWMIHSCLQKKLNKIKYMLMQAMFHLRMIHSCKTKIKKKKQKKKQNPYYEYY